MKQPCIYMVANKRHGTIYVGVTSYLPKRAYEHREGLIKGFTARYGCKLLVWYEAHATMMDAIQREKQIKAGSRTRKIALIESLNPTWQDLYDTLIQSSLRGASSLVFERRLRRSNPFLKILRKMDCFVTGELASPSPRLLAMTNACVRFHSPAHALMPWPSP